MILALSHIDIYVKDLIKSTKLYKDIFGFEISEYEKDHVDFESGFIKIRLNKTPKILFKSSLRLEVEDVHKIVNLLKEKGCTEIVSPILINKTIISSEILDYDGNKLVIWRNLNENEMEKPPELKKSKIWHSEEEELLQTLLKNVPLLFRGVARKKAVLEVENMNEDILISRHSVISGYIRATPDIMKHVTKKHLINLGFNPNDYKEEYLE
ncbi:MAG: DUF2621 family protein [Cyanobacteriota bacterium]